MYAVVTLNIPSSKQELYTYLVKENQDIFIGARVLVEFGFVKAIGYVIELTDECDYQGTVKEIEEVLDIENELSDEQILLAKEIASQNRVSLAKTLDLMLPALLKTKYRRYLHVQDIGKIDASLVLLFGGKKKVLINDAIKQNYNKIKKEIQKGNIEIGYDLYQYGRMKKEKVYFVVNDDFSLLSPKRFDIMTYIKNNGKVNKDSIIENVGASEWMIANLEDKGYIKSELVKKEVVTKTENKSKALTQYSFIQQNLINIYEKADYEKPFLLFTNDNRFQKMFLVDEVYKNLEKGNKVLIVVPSIVSAFEYSRFFKKSIKGYKTLTFSTATQNSDFYDNYFFVKEEEPMIIIATKAGIFLPIKNLGLITLIDEENINYTLEENGKYQVLDVLMFRSNYNKAKLILTSLSPSITSYYDAIHRKYILLPYNIDYKGKSELIDMHYEIENPILSKKMRDKIQENIDSDKISMLILDNKTYSSSLVCRSCGTVLKCPHCSVPLNYSSEKDVATCPYCSYKQEEIVCQKCNSTSFNKLGFGLEQLKEVIERDFKDSKVALIDSSLTSRVGKFEEALLKIEDGEVNIIIGTNIALEIKNPNIALIGLIKGDSFLSTSDYRSSELAYRFISYSLNRDSILTLIQTNEPDHYLFKSALKNDYKAFFGLEIASREKFNYPPFTIFSRVSVTGEYKSIYHCANYFKKIFTRLNLGEALGPIYSKKIKGLYVTIKYQDFSKVSKLIDEVEKKFIDEKVNVGFEKTPNFYN